MQCPSEIDRRAEKERLLAEHEAATGRWREAATICEQQHRAQLLEISQRVEALEAQVRRAEWRAQDAVKEKDLQIDK